jgi:hypothetical protein
MRSHGAIWPCNESMGHGGISLRSQQGHWFARWRCRGLRPLRSSCGCGRFPSQQQRPARRALRKAGHLERQHASVACSLLWHGISTALCKSPRGRRSAQPLRYSLASLPLSQVLPVFHSSSSSFVAHSISIKPAPLIRLLLDNPRG